MFIAMNRFRVAKGREPDFEELWLKRDTHLADVAGFVEFHLLRDPRRRVRALRLAHDLGLARRLRGVDQVGSLPGGA